MNITQLFNPVEKITGIEISQRRIHAVFLEQDKKGVVRMACASIALPAGTIRDSMLVNKQALAEMLKIFVRNNKGLFASKYGVVVLPSAFMYTDILKFPLLDRDQLAESVRLNLGAKTLFPLDAKDIYYDWQDASGKDPYHQEILLSFATKQNILPYLEACETAGLEPLAFETSSFAIARAVKNFKDTIGLSVRILDEGAEFSVIAGNELRFSRFVRMPDADNLDAFKEFIADQAQSVINFYAIENPTVPEITSAIVLSDFDQKREITDYLTKKLGLSVENIHPAGAINIEDAYGAAYGAALRGLIKREDDGLISLMPVGTEETYRKRRFVSYISLWSDIINTTAILLALFFGGMLFFLNTTAEKTSVQFEKLRAVSAKDTEMAELANEAAHFNSLVEKISTVTRQIYPWSTFISKIIPALAHDGITVHTISAPSPDAEIAVGITAKTRDSAINFRKYLEKNQLYEGVKMPPLGITQKENITFTVILKMKTPL